MIILLPKPNQLQIALSHLVTNVDTATKFLHNLKNMHLLAKT